MRRAALPLVAGLVAFLFFVGGGTAWALWAAHAEHPGGSVTAAGVGIDSALGDGLDGAQLSWNPTTQTGVVSAAGKITIENEGSREATATVTVTLVSTDHDSGDAANPDYKPALGQDLKVRYTPLADPNGSCAPTSTSALNLGAGHDYAASSSVAIAQASPSDPPETVPYQPVIPAGGSATVCVEIWLASTLIGNYGPGEFTLGIAPALRYAEGAAWTMTDAQSATLHIAAPPTEQFFNNPAARYNILNQGIAQGGTTPVWRCVQLQSGWTYPLGDFDSSPFDCVGSTQWQYNDGNWQYRLIRIKENGSPTNRYWINWANNVNTSSQPTEPRWTVDANGAVVKATASDSDVKQQWILIKNPTTGWYQFKNASTGLCIQRGTDSGPGLEWPYNYDFVSAACSASEPTQWFQISIKGTPYPNPAYALTCPAGVNTWSNGQDLTWPVNQGYQNEVTYRVYLDGTVVTPTDGTPPTRNGGTLLSGVTPSGGWTTVQMQNWASWVLSMSVGTHTLIVEQMIAYGDWYVVASRTIEKRAANNQTRCLA